MTYNYASTSVGVGVRYTLAANNDGLFVLSGANVVSTDNDAIFSDSEALSVTVAGTVFGSAGQDGMDLGLSLNGLGQNVSVLAGATVAGADDGLELTGLHHVVRNSGTIMGDYGVSLYGGASSQHEVTNYGTIEGYYFAIYNVSSSGATVKNFGTISSEGIAFSGSDTGNDRLVNRGQIVGDIYLNAGNDTYDGRGGRVEGNILGGVGSDTFFAGSEAEFFDGGDDSDALNFMNTSGVRVYLDNSGVNTGVAAGDKYYSFETVYGSTTGADTIFGDVAANNLYGFGGSDALYGGSAADNIFGELGTDKLYGGSGADNLYGGTGKDTLAGGTGNDHFIFNDKTEAGDVITDFSSSAAGNNDVIEISAFGFGVVLAAGAITAGQFITRADNLAQDANDFFIFRTTDKTLWFDSNGNAAGGLTLVADLQANATMNHLDILIS